MVRIELLFYGEKKAVSPGETSEKVASRLEGHTVYPGTRQDSC